MKRASWWLLATAVLALAVRAAGGAAPAASAPDAGQRPVVVTRVEGAIGPATADHLHRALALAADRHAQLLVLQLDTPGGLDSSMRRIIKDILASPVPVATYVAPNGARAASAGTYMLYASHIAAMAPASNLGAATPVSIGLGGGKPEPLPKAASGASSSAQPEPPGDPMAAKQIPDA